MYPTGWLLTGVPEGAGLGADVGTLDVGTDKVGRNGWGFGAGGGAAGWGGAADGAGVGGGRIEEAAWALPHEVWSAPIELIERQDAWTAVRAYNVKAR